MNQRPLSPAMESLFQRIEHALNSAEGMAILIGEQYGPEPKPPTPMGYNPRQIANAMVMLSQHGRCLLRALREDAEKVTYH
ncbi:hypothetical protein [Stenotrophomonas sp. NRRL B-14846]|uniref:hypothetical protein n=1 Tax=Stenotrophomonas sp. NRRL B-14846 TaxID=3162882 RepID=UPI003D2D8148